jgi:hypothetical protein
MMLLDFAEVAMGVVVEADRDNVEAADCRIKVVIVANVHLVKEDRDVVVLVSTELVEVVRTVETEDTVVGWSYSNPPSLGMEF